MLGTNASSWDKHSMVLLAVFNSKVKKSIKFTERFRKKSSVISKPNIRDNY